MQPSASEPDLCVIGASEAGRAAAMAAVALGLTVTLIDDETDADGLCNAEVLLEALRIHALRCVASSTSTDLGAMTTHLASAVRAASADRRLDRLAAMNIRVIRAKGRFIDAETVEAGGQQVRAWRTILAVGARNPSVSATGVAADCIVTLKSLHRLASWPRHLIVIGGSGDASAAAQGLARCGAAVTVIAETRLPGVDPELARPVLEALARDGVQVRAGTPIAIAPDVVGVSVRMQDGSGITGSHLLLATDGQPALNDLDLARGHIACVGETLRLSPALRTSNPRVYAIGHAAGASSTEMGIAQVGLVLRAAFFRFPGRAKPGVITRLIRTDPEIVSVGLTEQEAAAHGAAQIWRWPLAETAIGFAHGGAAGHLKVITDPKGRVLGAGAVGHTVRDLMPFWALAIDQGLDLGALSTVSFPSPALSEASRRLILRHTASRLGNPWLKRILAVSRRLG